MEKINGNHVAPEVINPLSGVPEQLIQTRDAFRKWAPPHLALRIGSRFYNAFCQPRVELGKVWPQYAGWMIGDGTMGVVQFFDENKKLREIAMEIVRLCGIEARGEEVPEVRWLEMGEALLPHMEKLTDIDHPAAGAAAQACFSVTVKDAGLALRYAINSAPLAYPGNKAAKEQALVANVNIFRKKIFELLKA